MEITTQCKCVFDSETSHIFTQIRRELLPLNLKEIFSHSLPLYREEENGGDSLSSTRANERDFSFICGKGITLFRSTEESTLLQPNSPLSTGEERESPPMNIPFKFKIPLLGEKTLPGEGKKEFTLFFLFESKELSTIITEKNIECVTLDEFLWKVKILTFQSQSEKKGEIEDIIDKVIVDNIYTLLKSSIKIFFQKK